MTHGATSVRDDREARRDGMHVARATGALLGVLALLAAAPAAGRLTFVEMQQEGVGGVAGLDGARALALSPDGAFLYVASEYGGSVAVFARAPNDGRLTFVQSVYNGVDGVEGLTDPRWLAVSPDGAHLYVTSEHDWALGALALFARDRSTGRLSFVRVYRPFTGAPMYAALQGAFGIVVSADGAYVYVCGKLGSALAVFARDAATGELALVQELWDGRDGVDGLYIDRMLTLSPDGAHAYVVGEWDASIAVFARDQSTGMLRFVEVQRGEGLQEVYTADVSPDGRHVYVGSGSELSLDSVGSLVVFARDAETGKLTRVEMWREGEHGIEGLRNPFAYVSPDGRSVYVIGWNTPLMIFARDPTTGRLTLREIKRDGEQGLDGLADPFYLVFSPDRAQLYVAARGDDAVTLFRIDDDVCVGDGNGDGEVTIDELITAVNNALGGCRSASAEQGCLASGGAVTSALCCLATGDFPDTCAIGPCGCAPEASHQVRACACGAERCFDGGSCVRP